MERSFQPPEPEELDDEPKRSRGRPKGARNKPADVSLTLDRTQKLYNRVEPFLDADHRKYLKDVLTGSTSLDPVRESELLIRYLSLLVTEGIGWALEEKRITRDLGTVISEYRQGIKELEDMRRRRREDELKRGEEGVVDPTHVPELEFLTRPPR